MLNSTYGFSHYDWLNSNTQCIFSASILIWSKVASSPAANEIAYNTEILKSNLCDYNDAYILVTGEITVVAAPATKVAFKNCAPFTKCVTKIDGTAIDDAMDLDLVT